MSLINSVIEVLVMNTLSIVCIFLLWEVYAHFMTKMHFYYLIYYSLRASVFFFVLPIIKILRFVKYYVDNGAWTLHFSFIEFIDYKITLMVFVIWIIGFMIKAVLMLRQPIRFCKITKHNDRIHNYTVKVESIKKELSYKRKIEVFQNFLFYTPVADGLLKKKIILPERIFSEKEINMILYHEILHLKNKDIWVKESLVR